MTVRATPPAPRSPTSSRTRSAIVGDHVNEPNPPKLPLYLYVGTVDGPQSGGHIALHVKAGNVRALRTLVGQSADQTFSYGDDTIFLLWQGKVPTVIDPSQLKAGDRITIRIRAPFRSSLSQIESTRGPSRGRPRARRRRPPPRPRRNPFHAPACPAPGPPRLTPFRVICRGSTRARYLGSWLRSGSRESRRRASDDWVGRWLDACSDLAELERSNPMIDAVIDEIDGRMIRVGDQWLADFASCNYLGFDLDPEIIAAVPG